MTPDKCSLLQSCDMFGVGSVPSSRIYHSNNNEQNVEPSGGFCKPTLLYYKELYSAMLQLYINI